MGGRDCVCFADVLWYCHGSAKNNDRQREIGEAAQKLTDNKIDIQLVSRDEFNKIMATSGISQMGMIGGSVYQDYAVNGNNGESESTSDTFEKVLGHPLSPLADALKELLQKQAVSGS